MGRWVLGTLGILIALVVVLILGLAGQGGLDVNDIDIIRQFITFMVPLATALLAAIKIGEWDTRLKNGHIGKKVAEHLERQDDPRLNAAVHKVVKKQLGEEENTNG